MRRWVMTVAVLAALSAWVGAQGPRPLPPAEQVRLFRTHRLLVDSLVDHSLDLAAARHPLDRADECRKTARTLGRSLTYALADRDPARLRQLAELLVAVVTDGLLPNLQEAGRTIPEASPDAQRLRHIREQTSADLESLRRSLHEAVEPHDAGDALPEILRRLAELENRLQPPNPPLLPKPQP